MESINSDFGGIVLPKLYVSLSLYVQRYIIVMLNSPWNDSCHPKLYRLSCVLHSSMKLPHILESSEPVNPAQKFGNCSQLCALTPNHIYYSVVSKLAKIHAEWVAKRPNCIGDRKTKHIWHRLVEPVGDFPHIVYVISHLIPQFHSKFCPNQFSIVRIITEKLLPSDLWAYNNNK